MGGWPQRTGGSRRTRSARAQVRHATQQGHAPLESTALGANGKSFSIVTATRALKPQKIVGQTF